MRSTDGGVQVFMAKNIKSNFLAGINAEKCLTRVFPSDLSLRVPVSQLCFRQSPQLAPCATWGTVWRHGNKAEWEHKADAFLIGFCGCL